MSPQIPPPFLLHLQYYHSLLLSLLSMLLSPLLPALPTPIPGPSLPTKTILITGCNSGIGFALASQLAQTGAEIHMLCRSLPRAEQAADRIREEVSGARVKVWGGVDAKVLESVRGFVEDWRKEGGMVVDVLVLNAGVSGPRAGEEFTEDGFETVYQTNFLSSFLLVHLLEKHLAPDARIIFTTSAAQYGGAFSDNFALSRVQGRIEQGFHIRRALSWKDMYLNSKLMQVAFSRALQERFDRQAAAAGTATTTTTSSKKPPQKSAHAFHPGFVLTPIMLKLDSADSGLEKWAGMILKLLLWMASSATEAAKTGVFLAVAGEEEICGGGGYWDRGARRISNVDFMPQSQLDRLWIRWCADAGVEW